MISDKFNVDNQVYGTPEDVDSYIDSSPDYRHVSQTRSASPQGQEDTAWQRDGSRYAKSYRLDRVQSSPL